MSLLYNSLIVSKSKIKWKTESQHVSAANRTEIYAVSLNNLLIFYMETVNLTKRSTNIVLNLIFSLSLLPVWHNHDVSIQNTCQHNSSLVLGAVFQQLQGLYLFHALWCLLLEWLVGLSPLCWFAGFVTFCWTFGNVLPWNLKSYLLFLYIFVSPACTLGPNNTCTPCHA